jgi:nucleotide-binding universal stress UspA family protein
MAIKTVLVHLANDVDWQNRLTAGQELARELKAHLIALYVAHPVHMPPGIEGRGASHAFLAEATAQARRKSADVERAVQDSCNTSGLSWEWAYGEESHLDRLMEQVHRTDITVVSQVSIDSFEDRLMFQMPEELIMHAGGPVLILPKGHEIRGFDKPHHILIAWKPTTQAIRAVRDTLPLLKAAEKVTVMTCERGHSAENADADIRAYLARHGIDAASYHNADTEHVGEAILATAERLDVTAIVMGAYGHSGLRERLFGGPTRFVISHTHIPTIMSH